METFSFFKRDDPEWKMDPPVPAAVPGVPLRVVAPAALASLWPDLIVVGRAWAQLLRGESLFLISLCLLLLGAGDDWPCVVRGILSCLRCLVPAHLVEVTVAGSLCFSASA